MKTKHITLALAILFAVLSALYIGLAWKLRTDREHVYPAAMVVTEVEQTAPDRWTVTARTMTGFRYAFETEDCDWMEGDIAAMIMDDNRTPVITDDKILSVRYCGYGDPADWTSLKKFFKPG